MGGMIAQIFAARFRERTKTLAIIFSSNNSAFLPPPAPRALLALLKGPPPDSPREVIIDNAVRVGKIIGSPRYRVPEEQARAEAAEGYDRNYYPQGVARHFGAVLGSGSLRPLQPPHRRAHRGDPRPGRQADAALRRPRGGPSHRRRPIGVIRRNGT